MIAKKNKRGDLFALYFVPLVLTLVLMSILAFVSNQNTVNAAIISPDKVLKIEDEKNIFEHNERIILNETIKSTYTDLDSLDNLKLQFCISIHPYSRFIISNRIDNNRKQIESKFETLNEWVGLCERIYTFSNNADGTQLMVNREPNQKQILLKPEDEREITYNIKLIYTHSKKYTIPLK